jgi:hypothetical protein
MTIKLPSTTCGYAATTALHARLVNYPKPWKTQSITEKGSFETVKCNTSDRPNWGQVPAPLNVDWKEWLVFDLRGCEVSPYGLRGCVGVYNPY